MKQLIICPHCEEKGDKRVLAELDGNVLTIQVKHRGKMHSTKIVAQECVVICGECDKTVFYKRKKING